MELLFESALRITVLALAVAFVLKVLGIRAPRLAHRAWSVVAVLMLLLPVLLAWGPRVMLPVLPPRGADIVTFAPGTDDTAGTREIASPAGVATVSHTPRATTWRSAATIVYAGGVLLLLLRLGIGLHRARAIRRGAIALHGRRSHPGCATPMTVGVFAPVVILPRDWPDWDPADLAAVLAHEDEHLRRRDPLVTVVALVNRAVFWFHPLSWWLHREVARLAEQACDAAVVAHGHDAGRYSSCLVRFARRVTAGRARVVPLATAMPGSGLSQRLRLLEQPLVRVPSATRVACAASAGMVIAAACTIATPAAATGPAPQRAGTDTRWQVVTTEHFEIHHDGLTPQQMASATRQAEAAYDRLSRTLQFDLPYVAPLVFTVREISADWMPSGLPESRSGRRQRAVFWARGLDDANNHDLIVHELTHLFAFEILPKASVSAPQLMEGLAEHMRGRWNSQDLGEVRAAAVIGAVPPAREPDIDSRVWGHALFDCVRAEHGEEGVRRLLFALRSRGTVTQAVPLALDTTNDAFDQRFQRYVIDTFN